MRKTLLALLFLLFLLVIACVYQKTYTLYSMQTTQEEPVVVIHENQANSINKKDVLTVVKKTAKQQTVKKESIKKENIQTAVNHTTKTPAMPKHEVKTSHKEIAETFTPSTDVKKEEKVVTIEKVVSHTPEVPKEEIKKVETEAVDYLLTVMKEHDDALSERDAAESRLHALIKKVLEERKQAINSMEEIAASSEKAQETRIEKRDQVSQTMIDNHTKGK